jgi:hypothetical protein
MSLYGFFFKNPSILQNLLACQVYHAYSSVPGGSGAPAYLAAGCWPHSGRLALAIGADSSPTRNIAAKIY